MAARVDNSADYLRRTASLPSVTNFTACGWCRVVNDRVNQWRYLFGFEDAASPTGGSDWHLLGWKDGGGATANRFHISFGAGSVGDFPSNPSLVDWFFWAMSSSGTAAGAQAAYFANAGATALVACGTPTGGVNNFTPAQMMWANDTYDEWVDVRLAGLKVWDAALSASEILQEMFQLAPVRRANLHGFWPMLAHTHLDDLSGNGRTLTAGGTLTTEEGPPVPFRIGRRRFIPVSAAGGGTTVAVNQTTETDTAQPIAWSPKERLLNQATETDLAQALARIKLVDVAQATESDLAQSIDPTKTITIAQASESDVAQALDALKALGVLQASETDEAQIISQVGEQIVAVNQVSETDQANTIALSPLYRFVAQALEIDLAQQITLAGVASAAFDWIVRARRRARR